MIAFTVHGTPAPQGSKRAFKHKTTGNIVVIADNHKPLTKWRNAVQAAAMEHGGTITPGAPAAIALDFYLARPKAHYGTGRNAEVIKPTAPLVPASKPDLDKLIRAVLDALTAAGTYTDDSKITAIFATKFYADRRPPGVHIHLQECAS
jgi:crossover junction endodeoxyribonuclease RusA